MCPSKNIAKITEAQLVIMPEHFGFAYIVTPALPVHAWIKARHLVAIVWGCPSMILISLHKKNDWLQENNTGCELACIEKYVASSQLKARVWNKL